MRVIDYIKNIFGRNKSTLDLKDNVAQLSINLNYDLSLELLCSWEADSECDDLAIALGTMIKTMTTGGYDGLISDSLKQSCKEYDNQKFIYKIIDAWQQETDQNANELFKKAPIVNPLKTFGESNFGG